MASVAWDLDSVPREDWGGPGPAHHYVKNNRWDVSGSVSPGGTPASIALNNVANGTDIYNRMGRCCSLKSVRVAIILRTPGVGTASPTPNMVKVAVVWDAAAEPVTPPVPSTFFGDANLQAASTPFSFRNQLNRDRSIILLHRDVYIPASSTTAVLGPADEINESLIIGEFLDVEWLNLTTSYTVGASTSSTGQLYLIIWGDTTCTWVADYSIRVTYDEREFGSPFGAMEGPFRAHAYDDA